jgi:P-type Cu+ transporter
MKRTEHQPCSPEPTKGDTMTTDPICGMTVDETKAISAERNGRTSYFCSEHCRKTFLSEDSPSTAGNDKSPAESPACCGGKSHNHDHHGHDDPAVPPSPAAKYYCPMCPGVESDKPGECPKCGMALERNPAWKPERKTIYSCPMHPEVRQDHPGDCPKCGMALEPVRMPASEDDGDNAELHDMTLRFRIAAALTLPVFILAMAHLVPALAHQSWADSHASRWLQFTLTTPVVAWAAWPFFRRGWRSILTGI